MARADRRPDARRRLALVGLPLAVVVAVLVGRGLPSRAQPATGSASRLDELRRPSNARARDERPAATGAPAAPAPPDVEPPAGEPGSAAEPPRSQPTGPLPTPRPVYTGVYAFQLPQFDIAASVYLMDFWVWFRWQGDDIDPTTSFELLNLYEGWDVLKVPIYVDDAGAAKHEDLGDGWRYQVLRIHSRFGRTFNVAAYPFDDQELTIAFEDNQNTIAEQVYVADAGTEAVDPGLSVDGWIIDHISATVSARGYPTNWGDPRSTPGQEQYSQFKYTIHIKRPVLAHLVTTVVPICIVMLIALAAFLIDPKYFGERVGLVTTCLISAVALQLTSAGALPTTSYLVLLDHVYNLAYLTIFIAMLETIFVVKLVDGQALGRARRLDRLGLAIGAGLFFGGTLALILLRA
jgi:hypothetical protein